jgi:deoxyribonuclease (pyrimidine dimer)
VAEYDEILMLLGYVRRYPKIVPGTIQERYCLGKGHIKFFKNKLLYIKKRHEVLKQEMKKRGFATNITVDLLTYPKELRNDWKPNCSDAIVIKKRITEKLLKKKDYYRYYGKLKSQKYLVGLIKKAKI